MAYTITKKPFYKEFTDRPNLIVDSWMDLSNPTESADLSVTMPLEKGKVYTLVAYGYNAKATNSRRVKITLPENDVVTHTVTLNLYTAAVRSIKFTCIQSGIYTFARYVYGTGDSYFGWAMLLEGNVTVDSTTQWRPSLSQMAAQTEPMLPVQGTDTGFGWSAVAPHTLVYDNGEFNFTFGSNLPTAWNEVIDGAETTLAAGTYRMAFQYKSNFPYTVTYGDMSLEDGAGNIIARIRVSAAAANTWYNAEAEFTLAVETGVSFIFYSRRIGNYTWGRYYWFRNFRFIDTVAEDKAQWLSTFLATGNSNEFTLQRTIHTVDSYEASTYSPMTWRLSLPSTFEGVAGDPVTMMFTDGSTAAGTIEEAEYVSPNMAVILDTLYDSTKIPEEVVCLPVGLYYTVKATTENGDIDLTLAATPNKYGEAKLDVSPILKTLVTRGHDGVYFGAAKEAKKSGEVTFSFAEVLDNSTEKVWIAEGLAWHYVEAAMPASKGGNLYEYDPSHGREAKWLNAFVKPRYTIGKPMDLTLICPKGSDTLRTKMMRYDIAGNLLSASTGDIQNHDVYQAAGAVATIPISDTLVVSPTAKITIEALEKAVPVITWPTPAPMTAGVALSSVQLNATADVAGVFSYYPASGDTLAEGTQILTCTFIPTDRDNYITVAEEVYVVVNAKLTPVLTWATPDAITYGTALSGTQLNAAATYGGSPVAGTFVYSPAAGATLDAGTQTLSVTFTPTDTTTYNIATKEVQLTVNKATPVITWADPSAITYGTALSSTQLNATADVAGVFVYDPPAGNVPHGGTQTLSTTFTPTDTVNYNMATDTASIVVNKAQPVITWADPVAITYGTPLSNTQLNAVAKYNGVAVLGTYAYNPPIGTVLAGGAQTLQVTFTPTFSANYNTAVDTAGITINKATPSITWNPSLTEITNGDDWLAGHLNATGSVAGTITYKYLDGGAALEVGDTLDVNANISSLALQAHLAPTQSGNYNAVDYPETGRWFDVEQDRCTLNNAYNNEGKTVTGIGDISHYININIYADVAWRIAELSGSGFTVKVDGAAISLPYVSSGNHIFNVSWDFPPSIEEAEQIFRISPLSGYKLEPINLTMKYFKTAER